jgi:hypothetical protein
VVGLKQHGSKYVGHLRRVGQGKELRGRPAAIGDLIAAGAALDARYVCWAAPDSPLADPSCQLLRCGGVGGAASRGTPVAVSTLVRIAVVQPSE